MSMDVSPLGGPERLGSSDRTVRAEAPSRKFSIPGADDIPASPPASVMREVQAAAQRVDLMREQGQELSFDFGTSGGLEISVRDLSGRVIRSVAPSEGLAIATGSRLEV